LFTSKAIFYFGLASLILTLALVLQDWQLAVLVLTLASLFFLTNAFGFPERVEIELDRKIVPGESFGEEDVRIIGKVRNRGDSYLENVEIEETLPIQISPERGTNHVYTSLLPNESVDLSMEFESPDRGHYSIGPLTARIRDAFGLYLSERRLEAETLAVMPKPEKIRGAELRPRHLGPWAGTIPSRTSGLGTEFYSLRGYYPGDDLKRVNWKASARANRLIVNEMEAERVTDVMVLLDTEVAFFEQSEKELFEQSVKAAASMTSLLLRQGNRVGLILQGEERGIVRPGFGKRQERRILYTLAAARPGASIIPTSYVMTLLAKLMLPSRAQMLIISPLLDRRVVEGIRQLVMAGYSVMVVTPTPREPEVYGSEAERLAFNIARLERANVLLAVEKVCSLVQWPVGLPLSRMLRGARGIRVPLRA
jgi:uncharacterized protein (DUF58 family)